MLILCFFIIKIIVYDLLNNKDVAETLFAKVDRMERQYFPLYGYTLIVLATEFLYDRFQQSLIQ